MCNCDPENYFKFLCVRLTVQYENLEPLPRTSLKPEWTFSHKHQIINKFRELGMTSNDDSGKNKTRNKNRKGKNGIKYVPMLDRKKENLDVTSVRKYIYME